MINKITVDETWTLNQTPSIQAAFNKDVRSLVSAFHDLGNPFEEESKDILSLIQRRFQISFLWRLLEMYGDWPRKVSSIHQGTTNSKILIKL